MLDSRLHTSNATTPANGPYVEPKDELDEKKRPSPIVTSPHKITETPEPKASHDRRGWRRRGDQRKSTVTLTAIKPTPRGQRTMDQTDATML
jgi:hypothetical protein